MLATEGFLRSINLSEESIKKYRDMLEESSSALKDLAKGQSKSGDLDGAFGASAKGNSLAWHTAMAQQEVAQAIDKIALGLQDYRTNIDLHVGDTEATDAHNGAYLRTFETATSCIQGDNFTSETVDNQCTAPEDQG